MKQSAFLALILSASSLIAEEIPQAPPLPAILSGLKDIDYTESSAAIRKLSAGIGEPVVTAGEECTESKEKFTILGTEFSGEYDFQRDKFYAWGFRATKLERAKATELLNALVPAIEARFGRSVRQVTLPSESDGPPDEVTSSFQWKVTGQRLGLDFSHSAQGFSVSFGSQHAMGGASSLIHLVDGNATPQAEILGRDGSRFRASLPENPSNREALFILRELVRRGVTGTLANSPLQPPDYGQEIAIFGGRNPEKKSFSVDWLKVKFPLSIERTLPNGSKVTEVHHGMGSLFPEGLSFEGKAIDLKALEEWNEEVPERS